MRRTELTSLGDPIEVAGLTRAFRAGGALQTGFCQLGSIKTNIGHLDAAAGIAGLIKTVMALYHKVIPATLHFEAPNTKLELADTPFYVSAETRKWETHGVPRRAGVSSFGVGGTNAHVVLEEAPALAPPEPSRQCHLFVISARSADASRLHRGLARALSRKMKTSILQMSLTPADRPACF